MGPASELRAIGLPFGDLGAAASRKKGLTPIRKAISEMNADESGANRFQVATAATLQLRQCADSTKIYGMRNTVVIPDSTNKPARIAVEIMATQRAIDRRRQEPANPVWDAELLRSSFFSGRYGVGVRCASLEVEAAVGRGDLLARARSVPSPSFAALSGPSRPSKQNGDRMTGRAVGPVPRSNQGAGGFG